jgi:biotin carboxyl carrier protein
MATNETYKVKANDFVYLLDRQAVESADVIQLAPGEFHIIKNNRSVKAKVLKSDPTGKLLKIEMEGETYDIEVKDELAQMLDSLGFSTTSTKHIKEIKAPMPGLVLQISVAEGQEVKEGDRILILEAMKMENSIVIHANAKIKKIRVQPGQAVDKGQVLVDLE